MEKEFISIIKAIALTPEFRKMKAYKHHIKGNLYEHCLKVAYLCYKHHKKHTLKIDITEFVQAALLHDYYLYDLHGDGQRHTFHWFKHPKTALENALKKYPNLTKIQKDMIKNHMFPLTLIPPSTKEGWIICFYDKIAAINDRFG